MTADAYARAIDRTRAATRPGRHWSFSDGIVRACGWGCYVERIEWSDADDVIRAIDGQSGYSVAGALLTPARLRSFVRWALRSANLEK